jgi:DNA-binding PadR family transcriptional regulator
MPQEQEEHELEQWVGPFMEAGIDLAALAVVRRGEVSVSEAAYNITDFTAGIMSVDEDRLARELGALVEKGYVELQEGRYSITSLGKQHMFRMLKQWNRYVDAMNNLWGCYYGT